MTTTQDLIYRLRKRAITTLTLSQAADALEALQAEVKHLNLHLKATQSGRDAALARLAELEKQEPVGVVARTWARWPNEGEVNIVAEWTNEASPPPEGTKLYASAGASPVEPSQAQPPAPSEAAREYMTGYSDGREWAAAQQPREPK